MKQIGRAFLIQGDARHYHAAGVATVITDPVWPNAPDGMFKINTTPVELLRAALAGIQCKRLAVILRSDSDPRFLQAVPKSMPFFRVMTMPYVVPGRFGRQLGGMEHAYCFGAPPKSRPGFHLIPGISPGAQQVKRDLGHPCPRSLEHMRWLVSRWSDPGDLVYDPFMGSGTTGVAAVEQGRDFLGVEIVPAYFEIACKRLAGAQEQTRLPVFGEGAAC